MHRLLRSYRVARRELDAVLAYLPSTLDGNRVERRTSFRGCQRPVLLIYGFFSQRRTFAVVERRLRRDGYGVFSINLGGLARNFNTRGIDDLADYVRAKVERLYARHEGMGPLTIIGHSKGGLIGAHYVKKLGGWRRTRQLVTLGTPHNGTPRAWLGAPIGFFARSVWQMLPMSPFIRRLQRGPWPEGVRLTSVWSREDGLAPFPSCLLDTQGLSHLRNVEVGGSHRELLFKKPVYEALLRELRLAEEAEAVRAAPLARRSG
jgi:pimeloyl-ACP methyl ester carboxylesterase